MYKNYGDVNFFEYGRLAELQKDGTVDVLVCNPVFGLRDPRYYQFDYINVDINDSWINVDAVCSYADVSKEDIIRFALACVDYYGTENFGGAAYYTDEQFKTESEILDSLRYYNIEEV